MTYPLLATVNKTHERCQAEGIPITKQMIKDLVKRNQLKTVRSACGLILISWPSFKDYLADNPEIPERYMLQEIR